MVIYVETVAAAMPAAAHRARSGVCQAPSLITMCRWDMALSCSPGSQWFLFRPWSLLLSPPKKNFEAPKAAEERPADRPSASQLMRFSGLSSVPAKGSKGVRAERRRRRRGPYNLTWMRVPVDKCMNRPKMLNKANLRIDDEGEEPAAKRRGR